MKLSKGEWSVLAATAVLLAAMGGYHLAAERAQPVGELPPSVSAFVPAESAAPPESAVPVDINRAGLEELMTLPGIGEKRAQAILDYRAEHGPFEYVEDLIQVPGIGEGILNGLLELTTAGRDEHAENTGG